MCYKCGKQSYYCETMPSVKRNKLINIQFSLNLASRVNNLPSSAHVISAIDFAPTHLYIKKFTSPFGLFHDSIGCQDSEF